MKSLAKKKIILYIILGLLILLFAAFIYKYRVRIEKIISPFFIAGIIAYIVKPLAARLEKRGLRSSAAILIIYGIFIAVIAVAAVFIFPELVNNIKELMNTLPDITNQYQKKLNGFVSLIRTSKWSDDIKLVVFNEIRNITAIVQGYAVGALKNALNVFIEMISVFVDVSLALFIAYYLVKDSERFKQGTLSLAPRRWRNWLVSVGREINEILERFIQGQLLTALIVGVMETGGLMLTGIKYPLVLGMIGGLSNIIPYFGPYIGAVPAVAVALVQSPLTALWAVLVFAVVQQIDNSFISPKIIEGKLGLHPVTTMLVVLIGGEFFGIMGMLLSVPVTAILKVIIKKTVEAIV